MYRNFEEVIICVSPLLILMFYHFHDNKFCLFKFIFGVNCPGCGMGHAVCALLKGNFLEALNYNPLVLIVLPILIYVWLKYVYKIFKKW